MNTKQLTCSVRLLLTTILIGMCMGNAWAESQHISLSSGWNFVSFQIEPDDPSIEEVLAGLNVESVWYYDALRAMNNQDPWLYYGWANPPFLNTLEMFHARKGYWVKMNSAGTLTIEGKILTDSIFFYPGYDGESGWNAAGFFSPTNNYTVENVFNQWTTAPYDTIWRYNPDTDSFEQLNTADEFEPGKAYWIETSKQFEFGPDIEVSPTVFEFGAKGDKGMIQLRNRGEGEVGWQATAHTNDGWDWLGLKEYSEDETEPVTQISGSVSTFNQPIYIYIDRGGLNPGEYKGIVRIISADKPDFPTDVEVSMVVEPLGGDYSGTVVIHSVNSKQIPEVSTGLYLSVANDGVEVTAVIHEEKSIVFPYDTVLSGGIVDTNFSTFAASGALVLEDADPLNPYKELGKTITRQLRLETTMVASGNNMLGGVYMETIEGLTGAPIEVAGEFRLHKVNDTPTNDGSDHMGALQGIVKDSDSNLPIEGASVIITGPGVTRYQPTPESGTFSFYIPFSAYVLDIQAPGYHSARENINFKKEDSSEVTIYLSSEEDIQGWTTDLTSIPESLDCSLTSGGPELNGIIYVITPGMAYAYEPETDTWQTLQPTPEAANGIAAINGLVYAIGPAHTYQGDPSIMGDGDTPGPQIQPWEQTSSLPLPMATTFGGGDPLIFNEDRVYVFSGRSADNASLTKVYYSDIQANGGLEPWIETTPLPEQYFDKAVVKAEGNVYLITGASGVTDVFYAPIESDGSLSGWISTASLYPSRQNFAAASYENYLYVSGGNSGGTRDFVKFTSINTDGSLNPWADTTPLPQVMEGHAMIVQNGYLYVMANDSSTYFAPINPDGTIGTWLSATSLPQPMKFYTVCAHNDYLYILGGTAPSTYYAKIMTDGSLGQWQTTHELPVSPGTLWAGAHGGFLYAAGGLDSGTFQDVVHYASFLSAWTEKTPMPVSVQNFGYTVFNDQIYIIGGDTGSSSTTFQRYTPSTDTWETDTDNGGTLAPLPQPRSSLLCSTINGQIHAFGGREDDGNTNDHFIYDPDSNTWTIANPIPYVNTGQFVTTLNDEIYLLGVDRGQGPNIVLKYSEASGWVYESSMPTARNYGVAAIYNRKIYAIGGEAQGSPVNAVEAYAPKKSAGFPVSGNYAFQWVAPALQFSTSADGSPIVGGSGRNMGVFVGCPVIGGTSPEGYVTPTRRGDKIMWSGSLPIQ